MQPGQINLDMKDNYFEILDSTLSSAKQKDYAGDSKFDALNSSFVQEFLHNSQHNCKVLSAIYIAHGTSN